MAHSVHMPFLLVVHCDYIAVLLCFGDFALL